jgi:hypothetical protein
MKVQSLAKRVDRLIDEREPDRQFHLAWHNLDGSYSVNRQRMDQATFDAWKATLPLRDHLYILRWKREGEA